MKLLRWSMFAFLYPSPYISNDETVTSLDLEYWSTYEYDWEQDEWNGYADFLSPPAQTVETGHGDCEDYAFVAASWAAHRGKDVTLSICFEEDSYLPQHMIASFDGNVYSSGDIYHDMEPEDYIEFHDTYTWSLDRNL